MNLKNMSDSELLFQTKNLVGEERRITNEVLHHLQEIQARRLFADLGFSSLHEYCTKELGYSDGSAWRRISAMKLLTEIPGIEEQLLEGKVNISTLSQVQNFLTNEKKHDNEFTKDEKLGLLGQIEGMSTRETERLLATISPQSALPDRERYISGEDIEIRFTAKCELVEKLNRLKGLLAHVPHTQTYAGLLEVLADLLLKQLDPVEKYKRREKRKAAKDAVNESAIQPSMEVEVSQVHEVSAKDEKSEIVENGTSAPEKRCVNGRRIPQKVYDEVWKRDEGRCSFVSPKTKRRCTSTHALEIDHVKPYSLGGKTTLDNLRLLCRQHNLLSAIQVFGKKKMEQYLSPNKAG